MAKPRPETSRTGGVRGCARRLTAALVLLCLVPLSALAAPRPSPVQPSPSLLRDDSLCLGCHGDTVDVEVLHASTHEGLACVDCHQGVETVPHAAELPPTDCDRCHYQESLREFPAADAEMTSLPSIHQAAREEGAADVPTCITCHGTHEVRPALAGVSAADKMHMVGICNNCHPNITDEYLNSIHGEALAADIADSPACADCHPEHSRDAEENGRDVFRGKVVTTCSSCHEDPGLQRRYALPGNRLGSYLGSYHGTATQLGDVRAANCFSCHGAHEILPSSDPRSSIHPKNLPKTCGRCHPGVNENVARGKVHVLATPESAAVLYYINLGFRWFTFAIIGGLVGHIALDLFGRWRRRSRE